MLNVDIFLHPSAIVESAGIGPGTRVGAFTHILPGARLGAGCDIGDHVFIENDVTIGGGVTIQSGVQLWDGLDIEDDVFIGPNATFTNDPLRAEDESRTIRRTHVKRGASIGANATILRGAVIGSCARIAAGTVVTRDVPPNAVIAGNPASIVGYAGLPAQPALAVTRVAPSQPAGVSPAKVPGVTIHRMPAVDDLRGQLTFGEMLVHVPFEVKRYFLVYQVANEQIRGEHAHRTLHQFLVCVHGSCHLVVDDGSSRQEVLLDNPALGLYIPPMVWAVQYQYSPDGVLLVLASDRYDAADYIRDYGEYLALKR